MRIAIQNGAAKLEFEGEPEEFDRLTSLLEIPSDLLVGARPNGPATSALATPESGTDEDALDEAPAGEIDARILAERLDEVGAKSDIYRVTVMAQAAVDAGMEGIGYKLAERLFIELGLRRPTNIGGTFQNAKGRGLVRLAARGIWVPTIAGENYARLGHKPSKRSPKPKAGSGGDP
jgi:hypothetical protein